MARPQAPVSVTVLGECVADAFTDPTRSSSDELALRALPGGGPANTAVALARLGTPTRFLGRFSTDVFGTLFRARLSASGVDLTGSLTAPEPSTLAVADLDETGQATYTFYADSAADWQWTDEELAATGWESAACLHTGSLALIRQPGGTRIEDHLAKAREHLTVSIDPNVRPLLVPPTAYRERLPHWCTLADILRLSEDDLALLLPGASPKRRATPGTPPARAWSCSLSADAEPSPPSTATASPSRPRPWTSSTPSAPETPSPRACSTASPPSDTSAADSTG